jgi:hypothetical protein
MIDPDTGNEYYKQEYIDRLKQEGKPTDNMKTWHDHRQSSISGMDTMALAQEILGTVKNFGLSYFLQSAAENTGVVEILRQCVPKCWQKIIVLACYLVAEDKAAAYCGDWAEGNECLDAGSMAPQRISELLCAFGYNERAQFFKRWYQHVRENEYVALDITSVSSYSENIGLLGWGYNRDGEDLPQANICLLYGENSMTPVYQAVYAGSLNDVTTLETTLNEFSAITGTTDIMVVMDKGFFKVKNINKMLGGAGHPPYKFLIPVSFTTNFANDQVKNERAGIGDIDNVIFTRDCSAPVRGIHRLCRWDKDTLIHTHIFYDPAHALAELNDRYGYVAKLKLMALEDCKDPKRQKEFGRFLAIADTRQTGGTVAVGIRKDVVEESLAHSGWLVLISNEIDCAQKAYDLYRANDVVEKS